ncbi:MAG TPA: TlpA disulfide reductase family protein [Candidatus Saccharimonadales bacterium]|nr:TlpA disulfide reductase family protein [Candidatus Saccharimonadales bacterium]
MTKTTFPGRAALALLALAGLCLAAGCSPQREKSAAGAPGQQAATSGGAAGTGAEAGAAGAEKPWPAPDFALATVGGGTVRLADLKGKVVLVDFWATWCPPCRKEIPHLVTLYQKYKDQGLEVVGLADDPRDHAQVAPFVARQKIPYTVAFSAENTADSFGGVVGYPTVFVINRTGQVVQKFIGYADEGNLEAAVKRQL